MKVKRFLLLGLLVALTALHLKGQTEGQTDSDGLRYYSSLGEYYNFSGGDFKSIEAVSFTYRFSPRSTWGGTLSVGYSGSRSMNENHHFIFYSLLCSLLPVDVERFRMIPSIGVGVAHGNDSIDKFVRMFLDVSVEVQYAISKTMYCGGELRYMANGKESFSYHLAGLKIGFLF